jgi:hypothetical protein
MNLIGSFGFIWDIMGYMIYIYIYVCMIYIYMIYIYDIYMIYDIYISYIYIVIKYNNPFHRDAYEPTSMLGWDEGYGA